MLAFITAPRILEMLERHKIVYVELPSADLDRTRAFFVAAFGWEFEDFGSVYTVFFGAGLNAGFYAADCASRTAVSACLIVFYSEALEASLTHLDACGAQIVKPIFVFPGGRRLHFEELTGNEFAVWSDK